MSISFAFFSWLIIYFLFVYYMPRFGLRFTVKKSQKGIRIMDVRRGLGKRGGKWSRKYKKSIDCNKPKGFSQRQYCAYGRNK